MRIITISREFGSGGRELGKRLADILSMNYYDREILFEIAKQIEMDENYIENVLNRNSLQGFSFTFGRTFYSMPTSNNITKILVAQQKILKSFAAEDKDFVVVGRSADIILKDQNPLNLFIYADMTSRIKRCQKKANENENLSERELEKKIKQIDANRAKQRELLTSSKWGQKEAYHLCVNTTDVIIKDVAPLIAKYAEFMFGRNM